MDVNVLFVDDDENVLNAMRRNFRRDPFGVYTASSGKAALRVIEENPIHIVVSDQQMPEMTGSELLQILKTRYPHTIRMMLTGKSDMETVLDAVNSGFLYQFISKPWNKDDFRLTLIRAVEYYRLSIEHRELQIRQKAQEAKLDQLTRLVHRHNSRLGVMLKKKGLITELLLKDANEIQTQTHQTLPEVLILNRFVSEEKILQVIEAELNLQRMTVRDRYFSPQTTFNMLSKDICQLNAVLPVEVVDNRMLLIMADPTDFDKIESFKAISGVAIKPAVAPFSEISAILHTLKDAKGKSTSSSEAPSVSEKSPAAQVRNSDTFYKLSFAEASPTNDNAVTQLVDAIIRNAIREAASDIHIEPKEQHAVVRYRVDGLLYNRSHYPMTLHPSVTSRIKVMAKLDISEKRLPQDGRIAVQLNQTDIDMRVSTLPTIYGEKAVLRLLNSSASIQEIENLGFSTNDLARLSTCMSLPQGIILVTGPTGSGKTTTLYSLIHRQATSDKNFVTVEEPVEYLMALAEQVNIQEKINLGFANALRAILRQDPNVILVGEIRDLETAEVAFQGALTGHLLLSTLHTNDAVSSIIRLRDLGVRPYIIAEALMGVVGQRLVRQLCSHCRVPTTPPDAMLQNMNISPGDWHDTAYTAGKGCEHCNQTGYIGRIGIFEVLRMDPELKGMIRTEAAENEIREASLVGGMTTMLDDAISKIKSGATSFDEVLRVLGPQRMMDLTCEKCGVNMTERFHYCPHCGAEMSNRCGNCQRVLKPDWKNCPDCGAPRR